MSKVTLFLLFTIIALSYSTLVEESEPFSCLCPQNSAEWFLYPDSLMAPDFFSKRYIEIKSILLCEHGVNIFFEAKQQGYQQQVCLVCHKPTVERILNSLPADSFVNVGDDEIEAISHQVGFDLTTYNAFIKKLQTFFNNPLASDKPLYFKKGFFRKRPILYLYPLELQWKSKVLPFEAEIDIYFTKCQ